VVAVQTRKLCAGGPAISALGLGCMPMSEFYGPADERESLSTIHRALDLGIDHLDTADIYGMGDNERLIGRAIARRRDSVVLATKIGIVRDRDGAFHGINGRPDYVTKACDASLRRLDADRIDLLYLHRADPGVPIEETVGAMAELVSKGKVRFLGLSEVSAATLVRAASVHPIAALQSEYSVWSRDPEDGALAACRELGVTFVAYSPLGRGFLTGRIRSCGDLADDDWRRANPRFAPESLAANLEILKRVEAIAKRKKCTPAQFALAWVLSAGDPVVAIPGTRRRTHLEENVGALAVEILPEDRSEIDETVPRSAVAGDRYTPESMRFVER
jgi:aryl-alcohol dehydrogenase-like predicted oxidoreductase